MEEIKYKIPYYAMNLQFFAGGGEKTEEATSKHLKDARNEGQVAKSQELITAVMLFSLFISLKVFGGYIANNILKAFHKAFRYISIYALDTPSIGNASAMIRQGMLDIFLTVIPVFAFAIVVAIVLNVLQVKWNVTTKPLKPKFNRLNPVSGFKKMFSLSKLFELLKAVVKIGIIFYLAYDTLVDEVVILKILYDLDLLNAVIYISDLVIDLGIKISAVYLLIGLVIFISFLNLNFW